MYWENWESRTILSEPPDFYRNLKLMEAMYEHAGWAPLLIPTHSLDWKLNFAW